jgi:hypothetical protein
MRTIKILAFVVVLFCTVQALYWPLLPKPGTVYSWWQLNWAAEAGFVLGAPALALALLSPLSGVWQDVFLVLMALLWALLVSFLVRIVAGWISHLVEP